MTSSPLGTVGTLEGEAVIHGRVASGFEPVLEAFRANFADHGEVGAQVVAYLDGECVVDLWGGAREAGEGAAPFARDTLVPVMSVSKGISAICAHMQRDRGLLDYDARVATYWPEFAQAGKAEITLRQVMAHEAALPVAEAAPAGSALGWGALIRGLEAQAPIWPPGRAVYHSTTYGHLVGELVRRTSGKSLADFIRTELAGPLGADVILGVGNADLPRVAYNVPNPANELMTRTPKPDPLFARTYRLMLGEDGAVPSPEAWVRGTFASGGMVASADGLARIFAALARGGELDGARLMGPETIALATTEQNSGPDPMHGDRFRNALGFVLNEKDWSYWGPGPRNFGTVGGGGYGVFADPDRKLSFAYVPVRFTTGYGLGEEQRRLVDALYASL